MICRLIGLVCFVCFVLYLRLLCGFVGVFCFDWLFVALGFGLGAGVVVLCFDCL